VVCDLLASIGDPSVETPDADDFVDLAEEFVPEGLFDDIVPVDAGVIVDAVNSLLAPVPEEWDILSDVINPLLLRGCSLSSSGPNKTRSGARIRGYGAMTCSKRQASMAIQVCIDHYSGGHWNQVKCDDAASANSPKVDEAVSIPCAPPGTSSFQVRVIGSAVGKDPGESAVGIISVADRIRCL
jgi:hypothetical protein